MNRQNTGKLCSIVQHATLEMFHVIGVGAMVFNTTFNSHEIKNGGIYDTQRINGTNGTKIMV